MASKHYKPLPEYLTIKYSGIHGLGLFATDDIDANFRIGITHIKDLRFEDGYIRTPLGGWFNHSTEPNCKVVHEDEFIFLETIKEIKNGEELTAFYSLYDPTKNSLSAFDFLETIKQDCIKAGVTYLFPETEKVIYPGSSEMQVSGYFDDKIGPTLACAIGKPIKDWYEILIHESCHMDQWSQKDLLWSNQYLNGIDCDKGMDEFLGGKQFHKDEYTYFVRTMQALEIDCEKRSVKKILDLGLDVDTKMYIQKANSYLLFYSIILETKKWCDVAPYNVQEIIDLMPDYFLNDYTNISEEILNLYKEKCYEKI